MKLNSYTIEPRSPLVFRSGRPFGQGGDAHGMAMPLPSTLAGAVRTFWGEQSGMDFGRKSISDEDAKILREKQVLGPLLAQSDERGLEYLFPQPADALYLSGAEKTGLFSLVPRVLPKGGGCDLPAGLQPVYLEESAGKSKPAKGPSWWRETFFHRWLMGEKPAVDELDELGWMGPQAELRTHVALDTGTQAGSDGLLYQTEGMEYRDQAQSRVFVFGCKELLQGPALMRLGGEGRPAVLQQSNGLPKMPEGLAQGVEQEGMLRLLLLTPALFSEGWKPGWLDDDLEGTPPGTQIRLKLEAVVLPRWEMVSGWDLQKGKPRAIRRMVPAGAVYWFKVVEGKGVADALWLSNMSDNLQDHRDGFGLAVPALWKQDSEVT